MIHKTYIPVLFNEKAFEFHYLTVNPHKSKLSYKSDNMLYTYTFSVKQEQKSKNAGIKKGA
jgi:hypothetical protein